MHDLRALLGDRYDAVIDKAMAAPKFYATRQYTIRDRVADTLAAVLPGLLAAAWDEGHRAGCSDPYARYGECDCGPNPYRAASGPEPAPGDAHTAGPATDANPDPNAPQKPKEARP